MENNLPFDASFGLRRESHEVSTHSPTYAPLVFAASGTEAHLFDVDPADGRMMLVIEPSNKAYTAGSIVLKPGGRAQTLHVRNVENGFYPAGSEPPGLTLKIVYTAKHKVEVYVDYWLCNVSGVSLRAEYGQSRILA